MLSDLKDRLIRHVSQSFILKKLDGKKSEIMRVVNGVNLVLTGLYFIAPVADQYLG